MTRIIGPVLLPVKICKKTYNQIIELDGRVIAECSTKAIAETLILTLNNHDKLTDEVERLREENEKLTKNQAEVMDMIESLKDNADLTVQFGDEWENDTQDCVTTGDLECLIEDILEMINRDTK